jgi:hypothetical protein
MGAEMSTNSTGDAESSGLYNGGSGPPQTARTARPAGRTLSTDTEFVPLSTVNTMVDMFQSALKNKDHVVEELGESLEQVRTELRLANGSSYDEEQLLNELQRLLKTNGELMSKNSSLESDNKMLQQEGDLLAQQLESVTFYMKNTAAELESERKNRVLNDQKYKEAREALRILYRDVQVLTKSMNAQRALMQSATNGSMSPRGGRAPMSPRKPGEPTINKVIRKDYVLPGNLAAELEAEFQQHMLQQQLNSAALTDGNANENMEPGTVPRTSSWNATFEY